jgi:copper(I)-binding protein
MRIAPVALALALLAAATAAQAQQPARPGAVEAERPWARATAPGAPTAAAYVTLRNRGDAPDRLLSGSSPAAERVEVHAHVHDQGGVMRMREVAGGVEIPAGATVEFRPGGLHLMLVGLRDRLVPGARFPLTLRFESGGAAELEVEVAGPGASGPPGSGGASGHGGHGHGPGG